MPERSFGSNQVALGGIILPLSAISIICFIDTGCRGPGPSSSRHCPHGASVPSVPQSAHKVNALVATQVLDAEQVVQYQAG